MTNAQFKKTSLYLLVGSAIILIALAILVRYHNVFGLDVFLSRDLQAEGDTPERRTLIYRTLYAISFFGKPVIAGLLIAFFAVFFWLYKYYRESIYILLTPIASIVNSIVKVIVNRPRPSGDLVNILAIENSQSFPSGHVNFYTVFFGFLFCALFFTPLIPRTLRLIVQAISIFLVISISFSRVYLGVHWVSDTIGGYLLGLMILSVFLYLYLKPKLK